METRLETKPGWKTTEFWLTVSGSLASILGAVAGILPPEYASIAVAVSAGLYSLSRGKAKQGMDPNPKQPTPPTGG